MVQGTANLMRDLYGGWLDANYGTRVETAYWTRWSHRKDRASEVAGAATQPAAIR
jgi:hypothetical protein